MTLRFSHLLSSRSPSLSSVIIDFLVEAVVYGHSYPALSADSLHLSSEVRSVLHTLYDASDKEISMDHLVEKDCLEVVVRSELEERLRELDCDGRVWSSGHIVADASCSGHPSAPAHPHTLEESLEEEGVVLPGKCPQRDKGPSLVLGHLEGRERESGKK